MHSIKWSADKDKGIQLRSELSHSVSLELVVYLVSFQFSEFLESRRHVRPEQPPRPVGPRPGSEAKRRRVRPSVRRRSSTVQFNTRVTVQ